MMSEQQKRANLKLALVLASVAVAFFVGFIARAALLGR